MKNISSLGRRMAKLLPKILLLLEISLVL
ncbi:hypothetical protein ACFL96_17210 [Thermoproteota archaeon]